MDKAKTTQTAKLIDELIASNPTAIRLNAVRLGLIQDGENVSRLSLINAIIEKKRTNNLSDKQSAKLMFELLSIETATRKLVWELANTEGSKQEIQELPSWFSFLLVFVFIIGIMAIIGVLGRTINKILN